MGNDGDAPTGVRREGNVHGIVAGVLGALVVAAFFFVVDLAAGRPLRTPSALGSALFLGTPLEPGAAADPVLVVGYTAVHGAIFVAIGLIASFALAISDRGSGPGFLILLTAALMLCFEVIFLGLAAVFVPGLAAELGAGMVALANLLASLGMAIYLLRVHR